ncbi:unnamed protein product [Dracunculus medinensis]|uniref:Lactamase_B domain-containing protein n=1 Tax=Dracunculus medinensis TaxID=318479 RepID=A0A0N4UQS3_DRAME|nr:unnamed protein product [Dracunculus medinensis]
MFGGRSVIVFFSSISLSRQPYQPCLLLKWPSVSILLDCALDLSSLASYLPETFKSARFSKLAHDHPLSSIKNLKRCGEHIFIDGPLEVHSMPLHCISMESVDAILISNWMSLIALPFFTENTGFHGTVYATDPTLYIGRLIMEELLEFFDRINREHKGNEWKEMDIFKTFPNLPSSDPREWRPFYSRADMENSLTRVQMTSFRESVNIHGVASAAAYSSGYSIGSCNWIIHTECEKVRQESLKDSSSTSNSSHHYWLSWLRWLQEQDISKLLGPTPSLVVIKAIPFSII